MPGASSSRGATSFAGDGRSAIGLYVHVPFCEAKCTYCHFAIDPRRPGEDRRFLTYCRAVEEGGGGATLAGERLLGARDRAAEALFTGLRRSDGIDLAAYRRRYDLDPLAAWRKGLDAASAAGLVVVHAGRLQLTDRGMLLSNEVFQTLVQAEMLLRARSEDVVAAFEESRQGERTGATGALVCTQCRNLVTSRASAISMAGSHAHTFANPHGFEFRIGCFADAPGCQEVSDESAYWTWFPGFVWRVSVCRQCGVHLGWLFRSPDARFFGLILDHLSQAD